MMIIDHLGSKTGRQLNVRDFPEPVSEIRNTSCPFKRDRIASDCQTYGVFPNILRMNSTCAFVSEVTIRSSSHPFVQAD